MGFQTDEMDTQQQNPAVFNNLNFKIQWMIITSFGKNEYMKFYMFEDFEKDYYGIDSLVGGT